MNGDRWFLGAVGGPAERHHRSEREDEGSRYGPHLECARPPKVGQTVMLVQASPKWTWAHVWNPNGCSNLTVLAQRCKQKMSVDQAATNRIFELGRASAVTITMPG